MLSSFPFSLLPESDCDFHIAVPDGLCAAGAALHRAVHPLAGDARRLRPRRVQGDVGRRQGDATCEWPLMIDIVLQFEFINKFT